MKLGLLYSLLFWSGGVGWCGKVDIKAISASNLIEVKLEAEVELGNKIQDLEKNSTISRKVQGDAVV